MRTASKQYGQALLFGRWTDCIKVRVSDVTGSAVVRLTEPCGAYRVGDIVQVGTGEFLRSTAADLSIADEYAEPRELTRDEQDLRDNPHPEEM